MNKVSILNSNVSPNLSVRALNALMTLSSLSWGFHPYPQPSPPGSSIEAQALASGPCVRYIVSETVSNLVFSALLYS